MLKLLDLFCGAGGAGEGYRLAGFEVTGVDYLPQKNNPHNFFQSDALEYLQRYGNDFDVIHASPPCQAYSKLKAMHPSKKYKTLIISTKRLLQQTSKLWAIENVETAPLARRSDLLGRHGVLLCGSMFGLGTDRGYLRRHRVFETSFPIPQPRCKHKGYAVGVYGHGGHTKKRRMLYRNEAAIAMQISWMNRDEMSQAIPPAYTEYIGQKIRAWIEG